MIVALSVAGLGLMMVSLALLLRALGKLDAISQRTRRTWLQLQNVISMLHNAGFKVKKPRDWNDDFNETRLIDDDIDESD